MNEDGEKSKEDWFQSSHNFGALPPELSGPDESRVVVFPVPYETTTSYRGGCRRGPAAIIDASANMELYDEDLRSEPCEMGVHTLAPLDVPDEAEKMIDRVDMVASEWLKKGKFVTVLGGEHTVSLGLVRALSRLYDPLSVLFLDAHADFRDSYKENRYSHACTARRISENCHIVQAGIRSLSKQEVLALDRENIRTFWASDFRGVRAAGKGVELIESVVGELADNVYISIDADVFDPSIMPAVGTPEPGGLLWDEVVDIIRAVASERRIVGADFVELTPIDGSVHSEFSAARLLQKLWGYALA
jgi:agmatinase